MLAKIKGLHILNENLVLNYLIPNHNLELQVSILPDRKLAILRLFVMQVNGFQVWKKNHTIIG